MKKIAMLLTLVLTLSLCCIPAYAAESTTDVPNIETAEEVGIVPYGAVSGYGSKWHNPETDRYGGSFGFRVSGISWPSAQLTVSFENFDTSTKLNVEVYYGNTCIFRRKNVGINDGPWENVKFTPGSTGVYTVVYSIVGGKNSPGRINCWIY